MNKFTKTAITVCKALALAIGVALFVTQIISPLDSSSITSLIAIAIICLSFSLIANQTITKISAG